MNLEELDDVLDRAVVDLQRAIPTAVAPVAVRDAGRRRPILIAGSAAMLAAVVTAAVVTVSRRDDDTVRVIDEPTTETATTTPATNLATTQAPTTTALGPNGGLLVTPTGDPVGRAFVAGPATLPSGWELVSAYDEGSAPQFELPAGSFHGVLAILDDQGLPSAPVVHVETSTTEPNIEGTRTPVDINGIPGEYVVWNQQFINVSSPSADVRWKAGDLWFTVSGPSLDFLLLQIARSAVLQPDGTVAVTAPDAFTYLPNTSIISSGGATVVYQGPKLSTIMITTRPARPGALVGNALANMTDPSRVTLHGGRPAVEFSDRRGLASIRFQPDDNWEVLISQASPASGSDLDVTLPLPRAEFNRIVEQLTVVEGDDWLQLQRDAARNYDSDDQLNLPGLKIATTRITEPSPIPVVSYGEADRSLDIYIERSYNGFFSLATEGDQIVSSTMYVNSSYSLMRAYGSEQPYVLVQGGSDIASIVVTWTDGTATPINLAEPFPDLADQRYALITDDLNIASFTITNTDGTTTTQTADQIT